MTSKREAFTPTFYKYHDQEHLSELNLRHDKLEQLVETVAEYPARVSYPHTLVPHSKVSSQYVKIIHTNEFKILPEELKTASTDIKKQALEKLEFISYIDAGNHLKTKLNNIQRKILNFQKGESTVGSSSLHSSTDTHNIVTSASTTMDESSDAFLINSQSENLTQSVNATMNEYEEMAKSASLPPPPTIKQSIPKPQVFEIREYISDTGSTTNEVVDITKQLEFIEKMAAEQPDGGSTTSYTEEDEFIRELAMIRGRLDESDEKDKFDDEGLDELFAKLEEKSQKLEKAQVAKAASASSSLMNPKTSQPNKQQQNGWKSGFLSSGTKSNQQKTSGTVEPMMPQEAKTKKGVQFAAVNDVRTIDSRSTVSLPAPSNASHSINDSAMTNVRKNVDKPVGNTIVEKQATTPKPFGNTILEKQPVGPKPFGNSIVEKQPTGPKPLGSTIIEKQPIGPKPLLAGNTRRS